MLKLTSGTSIEPEMLIIMETVDLYDDTINAMLPDECFLKFLRHHVKKIDEQIVKKAASHEERQQEIQAQK